MAYAKCGDCAHFRHNGGRTGRSRSSGYCERGRLSCMYRSSRACVRGYEPLAPERLSRGERIRRMTDTELADWLMSMPGADDCLDFCTRPGCEEPKRAAELFESKECRSCLIKWLGQPEK